MKKSICILFLLTVFSVGFLSAKVKINLDAGPVYTHFSSRADNNNVTNIWSTHTGGLNVLFGVEFIKHFGVYGTANFAFGKEFREGSYTKDYFVMYRKDADLTYVIDSQFGFFYVFNPVKKLDLTIGAGIGIGGSGRNWKYANIKTEGKISQANIGGGINVNASYMFTKMIGIYGGVSDTIYVPVSKEIKTKIGDTEKKVIDSSTSGKLANSFSCKAGIRIVF